MKKCACSRPAYDYICLQIAMGICIIGAKLLLSLFAVLLATTCKPATRNGVYIDIGCEIPLGLQFSLPTPTPFGLHHFYQWEVGRNTQK